MTTESTRRWHASEEARKLRHRPDLPEDSQPRPWRCTPPGKAIWCRLCGDCTCSRSRQVDRDACPMHGPGALHGKREPVLIP